MELTNEYKNIFDVEVPMVAPKRLLKQSDVRPLNFFGIDEEKTPRLSREEFKTLLFDRIVSLVEKYGSITLRILVEEYKTLRAYHTRKTSNEVLSILRDMFKIEVTYFGRVQYITMIKKLPPKKRVKKNNIISDYFEE